VGCEGGCGGGLRGSEPAVREEGIGGGEVGGGAVGSELGDGDVGLVVVGLVRGLARGGWEVGEKGVRGKVEGENKGKGIIAKKG